MVLGSPFLYQVLIVTQVKPRWPSAIPTTTQSDASLQEPNRASERATAAACSTARAAWRFPRERRMTAENEAFQAHPQTGMRPHGVKLVAMINSLTWGILSDSPLR